MQVMQVIARNIIRQKLRGNLSVSSGSLEFQHLALQVAGGRTTVPVIKHIEPECIWALFVPTCYSLQVNAMGGKVKIHTVISQFEKKCHLK